MAIEEKEVLRIARLARLRLEPEELAPLRAQLGAILDSMEELKAVDTTDVPPTSSVAGGRDVVRPDVPQSFPGRDDILAEAPWRDGPYFKVRKVIE